MLVQRVATAAVGIPVIVALILIGGAVYTAAAAVILALAALEFFAATDPDEARAEPRPRLQRTNSPLHRQRPPALIGAAAVVLLVVAADRGFDEWTGVLAGAVAAVFAYLVLHGDPRTGLRDWVWVIAGVTYVGFLGSHLVTLRNLADGRDWVFLAVFGTFGADTAAFFVGRAIGRVHLTPRISPGKTLEGTVAGLAGGFASVLALNWVTGLNEDAAKILPLALLLPLAAIVGDLAESLVKRGAGVKDTSELVPGHGGFLDRLDSVLFTVPLVYYYVTWAIL